MNHYTSTLNGSPDVNGNARSSAGRKTINCAMIVQIRDSFAFYILETVRKINLRGVFWQGAASHSDTETIELIQALGPQSDVLAILGKNSEQINAALAPIRRAGTHVLAFLSELDPTIRSSYIGGDNRAAGNLAAFLVGRRLERDPAPSVALITSRLGYRAWEDREIGFRSLLRRRFSGIQVIEVFGESASQSAVDPSAVAQSADRVSAIYNVTGDNRPFVSALQRIPPNTRPLYITHELDAESESLLRSGVIDFLIVHHFEHSIKSVSRALLDAFARNAQTVTSQVVPTELLSRFNPGPERQFRTDPAETPATASFALYDLKHKDRF